MTRNAQDIIDDMRNIVKPRIAEMLLEANFEGCGKEDKVEFETEFEMTLTLAEKALVQEPVLDKIRAEIIDDFVEFLIRENCEGCEECEPRLSTEWKPNFACVEEGRAKWLLDMAKRYKADKESE